MLIKNEILNLVTMLDRKKLMPLVENGSSF
jgi:hypothetical protein